MISITSAPNLITPPELITKNFIYNFHYTGNPLLTTLSNTLNNIVLSGIDIYADVNIVCNFLGKIQHITNLSENQQTLIIPNFYRNGVFASSVILPVNRTIIITTNGLISTSNF